MRQKKTGRRASPEERALAGNIVRLYLLAESSPDGKYCTNPESPPEDHEFFYATNTELLTRLESFAEHGTFESIDESEFKVLDIYFEFKDLRENGFSHESAIALVAEKYNKSCRQVEREVKKSREIWPQFAT